MKLETLTITQLVDYVWETATFDSAQLNLIKQAVSDLAGRLLTDDLVISLPRLEAVVLESANLESHNGEETLVQQCKLYLGLLNRFNNYIGQGIEELIAKHLNSVFSGSDWKCIRNAVQFPDLYIVNPQKKTLLLALEVKSWFVFAGDDITARFEVAPNIIRPDVRLILFPWHMTNLISGVPRLLAPYIGSAKALAERRDQIWLAGGLRQFMQGQVSPDRRIELPPATEAALNKTKTKSVAYQRKNGQFEKESENFGKVWRIYEPAINAEFYPRPCSSWFWGNPLQYGAKNWG
jgi:hypothetical protein